MSEGVQLEFDGQYLPESNSAISMSFSLRHILLEQLELVGTIDQKPETLALSVGTMGEAKGRLQDGCSFIAKAAILSESAARPSGGTRCVFTPESVTIARDAGPYGKAVFPAGTHCDYRWLLTGSVWLDKWIARNRDSAERKVTLPGNAGTIEVEYEEQTESIPQSYYGHLGLRMYSMPTLRYRTNASDRTLYDVTQSIPRDDILYLCACLSLFSGAKVDWIEETVSIEHSGDAQSTDQHVNREIRCFRSAIPKAPNDWGILPPTVPPQVLSKAIKRMRDHGENMVRAVQFYVSSFVLADEQEFVALSTALEAVKQAHIVNRVHSGILTDDHFRAVCHEIEVTVKTASSLSALDSESVAALLVKLPELNRPSYGDVVTEMCTELDVRHKEIYPTGLTFISVRNEMIHQGRVPERQTLRREIISLRRLVEQIFKQMLLREPK